MTCPHINSLAAVLAAIVNEQGSISIPFEQIKSAPMLKFYEDPGGMMLVVEVEGGGRA